MPEEKKNGIIGEKLRQLREDKGLSMSAISTEFGISIGAYQKYENNTRDVSTTLLSAIADFYNVSTDYLLGRTPVKAMATLGEGEPTEEEIRDIEGRIGGAYEQMSVETRRECIKALMQIVGDVFSDDTDRSEEQVQAAL